SNQKRGGQVSNPAARLSNSPVSGGSRDNKSVLHCWNSRKANRIHRKHCCKPLQRLNQTLTGRKGKKKKQERESQSAHGCRSQKCPDQRVKQTNEGELLNNLHIGNIAGDPDHGTE